MYHKLQTNYVVPNWPHLQGFEEKDKQYKEQQKEQYDHRHRVRSAPQLPADTEVGVNTQGASARYNHCYLYHTQILYCQYTIWNARRNRSHITQQINEETTTNNTHQTSGPDRRITRSQMGTQTT